MVAGEHFLVFLAMSYDSAVQIWLITRIVPASWQRLRKKEEA
jgi:hypothetical protein